MKDADMRLASLEEPAAATMALQRQQHNLSSRQHETTARQSGTKGHPIAARPRQSCQHIMPRQQTAQSLLLSLHLGLPHPAAKW